MLGTTATGSQILLLALIGHKSCLLHTLFVRHLRGELEWCISFSVHMCIDWVVQTTALNLLVHLGSFTLDERAWLKNSSFLGQISPGSSTGIHIPSTPIGDGHSTSHNPSKCVALFFCRGENPTKLPFRTAPPVESLFVALGSNHGCIESRRNTSVKAAAT